jgi:hypothetical protein
MVSFFFSNSSLLGIKGEVQKQFPVVTTTLAVSNRCSVKCGFLWDFCFYGLTCLVDLLRKLICMFQSVPFSMMSIWFFEL